MSTSQESASNHRKFMLSGTLPRYVRGTTWQIFRLWGSSGAWSRVRGGGADSAMKTRLVQSPRRSARSSRARPCLLHLAAMVWLRRRSCDSQRSSVPESFASVGSMRATKCRFTGRSMFLGDAFGGGVVWHRLSRGVDVRKACHRRTHRVYGVRGSTMALTGSSFHRRTQRSCYAIPTCSMTARCGSEWTSRPCQDAESFHLGSGGQIALNESTRPLTPKQASQATFSGHRVTTDFSVHASASPFPPATQVRPSREPPRIPWRLA